MRFAVRSGFAVVSGRRGVARLLSENAKMALGRGWWLTTLACGVLAFGLRPVRAVRKGLLSLLPAGDRGFPESSGPLDPKKVV